ncbi:hypothetical protein PUN4_2310003 [Paraburkholderia unamae]|uniref:hypothetical protein n=1 Tax=Paraburkholderia unamae TaxID=219649 RepID=UPI001CB262B4|nr:hypothetical protein [Paraburkholderia unamae]CAG9255416.1 hypothetical protein PUN4_2310003 [Paraburkholderia unamae]
MAGIVEDVTDDGGRIGARSSARALASDKAKSAVPYATWRMNLEGRVPISRPGRPVYELYADNERDASI